MPSSGLFAVLDGLSSTNGGGVACRLALEALPELLEQLPMQAALAEVSRQIWSQGLRSRAMYLMGAAVVVARLSGSSIEICHAGDCRAYLYDGTLRQLTEDHVEVSRGKQQLVRHLGLQVLEVDRSLVDVPAGGRLLLCSDGLHRELNFSEIESFVASEEPCQRLIEAALERGGRDNLTAVVVDL